MSYQWYELIKEDIFPEYRNFNGGASIRKTNDMLKIIDSFPDINDYAEDVYFTIGCYRLNLPIGDDQISSTFINHTYITDECCIIHNSNFMDKEQLLSKYPDITNNPYIPVPILFNK